MDKRTLKALKGSIKHWQENVDAETPDDATTDGFACDLCDEFHDKYDDLPECAGCPVYKKTGQTGCTGTPYFPAHHALRDWRFKGTSSHKQAWRKAAQAELDFLISLLPEGETVE